MPPPAAPGRAGRPRPEGMLTSLAARLFLWLAAVMAVVFAAYAFFTIRATSRQWTQVIHMSASRSSDLIRRATHQGMLLNRKEDVHETIRMIATGPGVHGVRIYDKRGRIIFSADDMEIGRQVDLRADACIICHDAERPLQSVPAEGRMRVYRGADGERLLGLIDPIFNSPECSSAPCHAHPPDQTVLGVLDVQMSMQYADDRLRATVRQLAGATVVVALIIGIASAGFIFRMVRVPVRRLIQGTERVARGDLETAIPEGARGELGQLARSFNTMMADLHQAREEITDWSRNLEQKVDQKTEELGRAQRQMLQMEKMASLGKLAATVAHEINNPLAGILTYARLVERELQESHGRLGDPAETERHLSLIRKEATRCGGIVRNLLLFARPSEARVAPHQLNPILSRSLMLVRHHLEMSGTTLEATLTEGDDALECDADQVQQAVVAVLVNAIEAMPGGGKLQVASYRDGEGLRIEVTDSGPGIAPDVLPHIFEPFFSTKESGGGVGLGLSVAYGIVRRHGGTIEADSEPGRGTTFRIWLPCRPPASREAGPPETAAAAAGAGPAGTHSA